MHLGFRYLSFLQTGRPFRSLRNIFSMAGGFRYKIWDPALIISQIITIQAIYYLGLGLWIALLNLFTGHHRSLDSIFKYQEIQIKENQGRAIMIAFILNALTCSLGLWKIVQRTKLCLDFTVTAHILHLIGCWIYVGYLPSQPSIWLLHLVTITLMCVLAEYLCMRTEMHSIPLLTSAKVDL